MCYIGITLIMITFYNNEIYAIGTYNLPPKRTPKNSPSGDRDNTQQLNPSDKEGVMRSISQLKFSLSQL